MQVHVAGAAKNNVHSVMFTAYFCGKMTCKPDNAVFACRKAPHCFQPAKLIRFCLSDILPSLLLEKSREGEVARRKEGNRKDVGMLRIACARGTLRASKACWNSMVLKIAKSKDENTFILIIKS